MDRDNIEVVQGPTLRHQDTTSVVGVIGAEKLVQLAFVPERDTKKKTGYQRKPSKKRVNDLAAELVKRSVDLPTAVLLSLRGVGKESALDHIEGDRYVLRLGPQKSGKQPKLNVVDGQHRIEALRKAINGGENLKNFKVAFVCLIGASEDEEMEQFHVVNSNSKSVSTDLAYDLMKSRAGFDSKYRETVIGKGEKWKIDAQNLVEYLSKNSGLWKDRIKLPNMEKGNTTVPSASFVRSLKFISQKTILFESSLEQQAQVINAYWDAIAEIYKPVFKKPEKYTLVRGLGVQVMHMIFHRAFELVRSTDGSIFKKDDFRKHLVKPLRNIEGTNGLGEEVRGVDFWVAGKQGAAGSYGGEQAKRVLADMLLDDFAPIDLQ